MVFVDRLKRLVIAGRREWILGGGGMLGVVALAWFGWVVPVRGEVVAKPPKQVIGATATITESNSGLPFSARIDTGATTCSIHAKKWEIEGAVRHRADNVGKPIRVLIENEKGEQAWVDSVVKSRVRVRSSVQKEDDYHGRYKVLLPLEWNGVRKEVLVTINDRTDMDYPLLIGRNFLRGDFVVDVDIDNADPAVEADPAADESESEE
jgi:hypothetical protein